VLGRVRASEGREGEGGGEGQGGYVIISLGMTARPSEETRAVGWSGGSGWKDERPERGEGASEGGETRRGGQRGRGGSQREQREEASEGVERGSRRVGRVSVGRGMRPMRRDGTKLSKYCVEGSTFNVQRSMMS
jgi:hypothetical protein